MCTSCRDMGISARCCFAFLAETRSFATLVPSVVVLRGMEGRRGAQVQLGYSFPTIGKQQIGMCRLAP